MVREVELVLPPEKAFDEVQLDHSIRVKGRLSESQKYRILRRSVDARKKEIKVRLRVGIYQGEEEPLIQYRKPDKNVTHAAPVVVVGSGPAGLFAALKLIECGYKPVVIERGKDVRARRRDLAAINKHHTVNPDSNYCFGEGGAGTYSDGKLYTRSKKRGDVLRILEILVAFGAKTSILYDAHPHIGTNKLPGIIEAIREHILFCGGEILFNTRVTDLLLDNDEILGVVTQDGEKIKGEGVILATGHSARDIFELLYKRKVLIEAKPFALGLRVEHPQSIIDQIQYHCDHRGDFLPAAAYSLVHQTTHGGVYSFCMCPGGFIVPSATQTGEVVVNGMSPSRRNSRYANSGIVSEVNASLIDLSYPLSGMEFQRNIEQNASKVAGGGQTAPAQRLVDFVEGRVSSSLPDTSYQPGLLSVELSEILPQIISDSLREAFKNFGKKMKGFLTNEAQVVGVESRTSSPVRIPRSRESGEHLHVRRLFPTGEGAGYAGGIVSAAMDGEHMAGNFVKLYKRVSKLR